MVSHQSILGLSSKAAVSAYHKLSLNCRMESCGCSDCKHVYLDNDLGLVIFSCFFLVYHIFSPIFTIPLCPLQFVQQATNYPSITLLPYLCHMLEPGSPTQLTETARFAIDRLNLHYIVFKNINIFDSRQQCL